MDILNYSFFQHALIGSLLASILCGIIGTYIVTRRLVFYKWRNYACIVRWHWYWGILGHQSHSIGNGVLYHERLRCAVVVD